jgi:hypothetical protein
MPDMSTVLPLLAGRDMIGIAGGNGIYARMFFVSAVLVDVDKQEQAMEKGFNLDIYQ